MATKEIVLEALTRNKGSFVSGEFLAELCGVSRTAVWKSVKKLREDGFYIEGTTNGGYLLKDNFDSEDIFSKDLFSFYFQNNYPDFKDSKIECFKEIDSTNSYAKRLLSEAGNLYSSDGTLTEAGKTLKNSVYVAESQTAGRGRMGRSFVSPSGSGIYLSVIYAPQNGITNPALLTAFTAVAVKRAIFKICGIEAKIKWINDLFYNNKKICGILAEGITNFETGIIEAAVIGIGINITDNPDVFPDDVKKIAGSIGKKVSRCELAAAVSGEVLSIFDEKQSDVIREYKNASFLIGENVFVHPIIFTEAGIYKARAIDIDENAGLVVQKEDGTIITLRSGEVRVRPEE